MKKVGFGNDKTGLEWIGFHIASMNYYLNKHKYHGL